MQSIFLILVSIIFISGCSDKSSNYSPKETNPTQLPVPVNNKVVDISNLSLSSLEIDVEEIVNFGITTRELFQLNLKIIVQNNSLQDQDISFSGLQNGFYLKINRCPNLIPAKKQCEIVVSFSSRGLYNGIQLSNLVIESGINSLSVPLFAEVSQQPNPDNTGTPELSVIMSGDFSQSLPLPSRKVYVENIGDGSIKDFKVILPNGYTLFINRCPNNLKPNETCSMEILHKNYRTDSPPIGDMFIRSEHGEDNEVAAQRVELKAPVIEVVEIQKIPTYTDFPISTKVLPCSGSETFTNTLTSCKDQFGFELNPIFCEPAFSITYQSPMGEDSSFESISGGRLYKFCELGSDIRQNARLECSPDFFDNGSFQCIGRTYTANWIDPVNPLMICDGSITLNKILHQCIRDDDNSSVNLSFCSSAIPPTISYSSLAGDKSFSDAVGTGTVTCDAAQTYAVAEVISGRKKYLTCTDTINKHVENFVCVNNTYSPIWSDPTNPLLACGGTTTVSKPLATCSRVHDTAVVNASFCSSFTAPTVNFSSPYSSTPFADAMGSGNNVCEVAATIARKDYTSCSGIYTLSGTTCIESWPRGSDGNLTVTGSVDLAVLYPGRTTFDFESLTINSGATLILPSTAGFVTIGVRQNFVLNGSINGVGKIDSAGGTYSMTFPESSQTASYNIVQAAGGSGGSGGKATGAVNSGGGGGSGCSSGSWAGVGGGGGGGSFGGRTGGVGGTCGGPGGGGSGNGNNLAGSGNITFGNGGDASAQGSCGSNGGSGGGSGGGSSGNSYCGGASVGAGGGGGYRGKHGSLLAMKVKGSVSGTGNINLSGQAGFKGGNGGSGALGGGGGGGGGGAGGSGGYFKLFWKTSNTLSTSNVIATGGAGGAIGTASAGLSLTSSTNGVVGGTGSSGSSSITGY